MEKYIISILILLSLFQLHSQELLKEISKTFNNGQPMFVDYLEMENLKKVKTELYNEDGKIIFSMQFNPKTGLPDGEFYDLINNGSFNNGVLTCHNCMLVEANSPSVYTYNYNKQNTIITKGDVVNGRLVGEVKLYSISEDTYRKVNWQSTRKYVAAGAGIGFRDVVTYRTGNFKETLLDTKHYNSNGVLDGELIIGEKGRWNAKLNLKNGIVKSYVAYDRNNICIDSLFNENKIWRVNYKFIKNDGFLVFKNPQEFRPPNRWGDMNFLNIPFFRNKEFKDHYGRTDQNGIIAIGGNQIYGWEEFDGSMSQHKKSINTGSPPLGLDSNGLFTINLQGMFDNIIFYNLGQTNYYGSGKPDMYFRDGSSRENNLFVLIYNYLINNQNKNLRYMFLSWDYRESDLPLRVLITSLNSEHYLKIKNNDALRKNSFTKYLKINSYSSINKLPWKRNKGDGYSYITLQDFFGEVISMADYLKACRESIENKETEIQEIWVWNHETNTYDKVNFDILIKIEKEKKINSEAELKAKEEAELKAKEKAKKKAADEIQNTLNTLNALEPTYTSEKRSAYGKYRRGLRDHKEELIKSYNLDITRIVFFYDDDIKQLLYLAYVFPNLDDLKKFKDEILRINGSEFYCTDTNNFTLYYKKMN